MRGRRGRPKTRKTTENATGISQAASALRELAINYSAAKRNGLTERYLTGMLHGYLGAVFKTRLKSEHTVATRVNGKRGRPEQVDFAIGRMRRGNGAWSPDSVVELAVRRPKHLQGADPSCNITEVSKLCKADAKHRILLLLDLTNNDSGESLKKKYLKYRRTRGRPIKDAFIRVIYVGEDGTLRFKIPAQRLAPTKQKRSRRKRQTTSRA